MSGVVATPARFNISRIDGDDSEPEFDSIRDYERYIYAEEIAQFGVEALLWPGRSSDSGFLGRKERLADVIASDTKVLEELRVTHNALADKLDNILLAARDQLRNKRVGDDELFCTRCPAIRARNSEPPDPGPPILRGSRRPATASTRASSHSCSTSRDYDAALTGALEARPWNSVDCSTVVGSAS